MNERGTDTKPNFTLPHVIRRPKDKRHLSLMKWGESRREKISVCLTDYETITEE